MSATASAAARAAPADRASVGAGALQFLVAAIDPTPIHQAIEAVVE